MIKLHFEKIEEREESKKEEFFKPTQGSTKMELEALLPPSSRATMGN